MSPCHDAVLFSLCLSFFFFFFWGGDFIRRVLGQLPCSPSPLAVKIFHRGCFWTTPSWWGPAWLIIKCLSCQALRQHPNLFWQLRLRTHTLSKRQARAHEHMSACTCYTLSTDACTGVCTQVHRQSINQGVYWGWGINAVGRGPHVVTMVTELKVAGAQLETVAPFQIGPQACVHSAPRSAVFGCLVDVQ